eukprot:349819-Chlamydomonas_euryale.AAC.1
MPKPLEERLAADRARREASAAEAAREREAARMVKVQMGRLEVTHSDCLRRIVGVKLTDRHRLETIREQCGTSSLDLMVRRRTLQWMGHVLRMDEVACHG